jgi:hypothetical protein
MLLCMDRRPPWRPGRARQPLRSELILPMLRLQQNYLNGRAKPSV